MNQIKQIHAFTLRNGLDDIQALVLKLLQVPNLPYAHALLLSHPHPPPTFLYNKLFQAYARGAGNAFEPCAALFARMRRPPQPPLLRLPLLRLRRFRSPRSRPRPPRPLPPLRPPVRRLHRHLSPRPLRQVLPPRLRPPPVRRVALP
ncbi:hypothetical protein OPV22_009382 [Ensete ventricosum]|uniref:Pentatricopeptide repeat-containing protein n=1 Tax=Ensete ventricosum TaxID=4639 RepID=A0AAV8PZD1_ENSVE|nr:hypothetical protein OPV22_009382 [Ensete ventricosum]